MKQLENILVAVDISCDEHQHLEDVLELNLHQQASITLLNVFPSEAEHPKLKNLVAQYATEMLERLKSNLVERGVKTVQTYLEYGETAQSIIKVAQRIGADLIMLYEKHAGVKHVVSPVVKKTIRLSPIPVWTTVKDSRKTIKKILCPVDGSLASKEALEVALWLMEIYRAQLTVLHVFEPITHVPTLVKVDLQEVNREGRRQAEIQLDEFLRDFDRYKFLIEIAEGSPTEEILSHLSDYDLLVMGTNGRTGLSRIVLGSVTESVIQNVSCSFVTVHRQLLLSEKAESRLDALGRHFNDGVYLLERGNHEQAIKLFATCLNYDELYVPAMLKMSEAHSKMGNIQQAKHYHLQAEYVLKHQWGTKMAEKILQDLNTN